MKRALFENRSVVLLAGLGVVALFYLGIAVARSGPSSPSSTFAGAKAPSSVALAKAHFERGQQVYLQTCFVCHQTDGQGLPGQFPPLARSDYLMADTARAIRIVLAGQTGKIIVNGRTYDGVMLPLDYLSDEDVAAVLNYARNSWGNAGEVVTADDVHRARQRLRAGVVQAGAASRR